jgi:hypothetical protein
MRDLDRKAADLAAAAAAERQKDAIVSWSFTSMEDGEKNDGARNGLVRV